MSKSDAYCQRRPGSDGYNTMMAATAYNMKHRMNKKTFSSFASWLLKLVMRL